MTLKEGTKHDESKPRVGLISPIALLAEAQVMTYGAQKYEAHNFRKGISFQRVVDAAFRHLIAFNAGEDIDPESGLPHLAHLRCCAAFLLEYAVTHPEFDDRYKLRG